MPKLYWNRVSGEQLGGEECRIRGTCVDANGIEWRRVTWMDTDTGELEYFMTDAAGMIAMENRQPVRVFTKTAAPLRIVEREPLSALGVVGGPVVAESWRDKPPML